MRTGRAEGSHVSRKRNARRGNRSALLALVVIALAGAGGLWWLTAPHRSGVPQSLAVAPLTAASAPEETEPAQLPPAAPPAPIASSAPTLSPEPIPSTPSPSPSL